jgi:deoxyribodipyrimidine photo-lyase
MFDSRRIEHINDAQYKTGDILYWTEWALRTEWNCGLTYASEFAEQKKVSLLPLITIDSEYQHENIRQLVFLVESITELSESYRGKNLQLSVAYGDTQSILEETITKNTIGMVVASASYIRYFQTILKHLGKKLDIPVILIDDASLLPPWIVSDHVEYGAYTLRKKYWNTVTMLSPEKSITPTKVKCTQSHNDLAKIVTASWYKKYLSDLSQISQGHANKFIGGESSAQELWGKFKKNKLDKYDIARNNPNEENTSLLSPYLHFGCISPVQIYHECSELKTGNSKLETPLNAFLEECLVRRELAINMWYYEKHPDKWNCLPDWVIKTLNEDREKQTSLLTQNEYSLDDLRHGKTEDPLWNAAQHELVRTGKIHGYVRMYWGKQLLRWFRDWKKAYWIGVYLNDTYAVDGCSPNGYTGIAWCFGKHDRPFPPKKTHYGLVRSMTFWGMKKKFDVEKYIENWK